MAAVLALVAFGSADDPALGTYDASPTYVDADGTHRIWFDDALTG